MSVIRQPHPYAHAPFVNWKVKENLGGSVKEIENHGHPGQRGRPAACPGAKSRRL